MTNVLKKYGVIAFLAIIVLTYIAWLILSKQGLDKIPSRGVFV